MEECATSSAVFGREPGEVWQDQEGIGTIHLFVWNVARLMNKIS
jgi:hypothetical protein